MARHLKPRKRDRIIDALHGRISRVDSLRHAVLMFITNKANDTKTYFRTSSKRTIATDIGAFLLLAFLLLISPVSLIIGIILW